MSHPDATTALKIYKRFCSQTEHVVAYLGVAKKLQNVINVPIPNLKHVRRSFWAVRELTWRKGTSLTGWLARRIPEGSQLRGEQDGVQGEQKDCRWQAADSQKYRR
jgi:hypothetical protein